MFTDDAREAILALPHVVDAEPRDCVLMAGFDADGVLRHRHAFPVAGSRPLDEPLLESSLWRDDVTHAMVVVYSAAPTLDLRPLASAWRYRGRTAAVAAWAGRSEWQDQLCDAAGCCAKGPHRYTAHLPAHPDFAPVGDRPQAAGAWRRARWQEWQAAFDAAIVGTPLTPDQMSRLTRSLHDIPLRDAVLASSADELQRASVTTTLEQLAARATLGASVPLHTCLAAMRYLDADFTACAELVAWVLDAEDYSLAQLLRNGIDMGAPASLLARSFSAFSPSQLLAA